MSDITKCTGKDCPVKEKCYRYTSPEDSRQSWFYESPHQTIDGEFACSYYWGENAESIWFPSKDKTELK